MSQEKSSHAQYSTDIYGTVCALKTTFSYISLLFETKGYNEFDGFYVSEIDLVK